MYWIAWNRKYRPAHKVILSFDLEREDFHVIPYPPDVSDPMNDYLVELKEDLCLVCPGSMSRGKSSFILWMLKEREDNNRVFG